MNNWAPPVNVLKPPGIQFAEEMSELFIHDKGELVLLFLKGFVM